MGAKEKYVLLEHKADVLFEASGASFEEALENSAQALFDTAAKTALLKGERRIAITQTASKLEELVVFTLGSLLSEGDANEVFFKSFKVKKFGERKSERGKEFFVEGEAFGDAEKKEFGGTVVKAVTFHELRVTRPNVKEKNWRIRALLDV